MQLTQGDARKLLKAVGLRVTAPRLAVLETVAAATGPLSHSEVVESLRKTDWDPATIYRNLVKLRDSGLLVVANRANGIDRYALAVAPGDQHRHPHFVCDDCGQVSCLPESVVPPQSGEGRWNASIQRAMVQLRGDCPDCIKPV